MPYTQTAWETALEELVERLRRARSIFVLSGAGMSAESGLPTFRGVNGYWGKHRVEDLASPEGFERDAQPNAAHHALAELESLVLVMTVATQNVDSLHARAGSHNVLELHGRSIPMRRRSASAATALSAKAQRSPCLGSLLRCEPDNAARQCRNHPCAKNAIPTIVAPTATKSSAFVRISSVIETSTIDTSNNVAETSYFSYACMKRSDLL